MIEDMTHWERNRAAERRAANRSPPEGPQKYFEGYLFRDRRLSPDVNRLAAHVYNRYLRDEVLLFQRRIGPFHYQYFYLELANKNRRRVKGR